MWQLARKRSKTALLAYSELFLHLFDSRDGLALIKLNIENPTQHRRVKKPRKGLFAHPGPDCNCKSPMPVLYPRLFSRAWPDGGFGRVPSVSEFRIIAQRGPILAFVCWLPLRTTNSNTLTKIIFRSSSYVRG